MNEPNLKDSAAAGVAEELNSAAPTLPKKKFLPDVVDGLFALIYLALGYLYIYAVLEGMLWSWQRTQDVASLYLFFGAYAAAVLGYLYLKKVKPAPESWLWLAVLFCLGVPLPYYSVAPLWQFTLLHLVALYWPVCAAGALSCGGKTGGFLVIDCLKAFLILPWGNAFCLVRSAVGNLRRSNAGRRVVTVLIGVLVAVPLLCIALPLLSRADAGFSILMANVYFWLSDHVGEVVVRLVLSLPVSALLFGVVCGSVHRRHTDAIPPAAVKNACAVVRCLPEGVLATVFLLLCGAYAAFLTLQGGYAFGAFGGLLPEGFSYSEYAREGFFELCRIGGLNLAVILGANLLARKTRRESLVLRVCNLVLCALSLLLIATAAAKLGMYIAAYGLTVNRVLPAMFLLWMTLVFVALMIWQFRSFSVVRLAALAGAVLVCALCVCNVRGLCRAYNQAGVAAGKLPEECLYSTAKEADVWGLYGFG